MLNTEDASAPALALPERHAEQLQQAAPFFVGIGRGHNYDLHAAYLVDSVVINLRENQLLAQAQSEITVPVKRPGGYAREVAHASHGNVEQLVQEVVHTGAAQ